MDDQTENRRRYKLVVALDESDYAQSVLEHALDQASRHDAPDLNVIGVIESRGAPLDEASEVVRERIHEMLRATLFTFGAGSDWRVRIHVRRGIPAEEIAALADEIQADMVVLGRFGVNGAHRRHRGSVADDVVRLAPCPILVVQIPDYTRVETEAQCGDCVTVRRDTDGEKWFCEAHLASPEERMGIVATLLPHADWGLGGGLIG